MKYMMGSDPELMLCDAKTKALVSAIPVIKEGKGEGRVLKGKRKNRVIHDNVLVELNTEPASSEEDFVDIIGDALKATAKIVSKKGLELLPRASADFPACELENAEAKIFGCDPDFNAWLLEINSVPADAAHRPFRSAGGHLHIGKSTNKELNAILDDDYGKCDVIKALDIFCGIPSVFIDTDPTAPARRALYGGAGAHRPKVYGVEYRALGNWWLRTPQHTRVVYQLTSAALQCLVDGKLPALIESIGEDNVQSLINQSKVVESKAVYLKNIVPFLSKETVTLVSEVTTNVHEDFSIAWAL